MYPCRRGAGTKCTGQETWSTRNLNVLLIKFGCQPFYSSPFGWCIYWNALRTGVLSQQGFAQCIAGRNLNLFGVFFENEVTIRETRYMLMQHFEKLVSNKCGDHEEFLLLQSQHTQKGGEFQLPFLGLCAQRRRRNWLFWSKKEESASISRKGKNKIKKQPPPQQQTTRLRTLDHAIIGLCWTPLCRDFWLLAAFWNSLTVLLFKLSVGDSLVSLLGCLCFFFSYFFSWWVILPAYTLSSDRPDNEVTGVAWEQNWPHHPQPLCLPCHW